MEMPPDRSLAKLPWSGVVTSVQPRIGLTRSFDQRHHSYLGYVIRVHGAIGKETREFTVALGKGAHQKHQLRIGDQIQGEGVPVADECAETAELYKVSKLKLGERGSTERGAGPPWHGVPPPLPVYRERGHRRLDAATFDERCTTCVWGCRMAVEMIIDHWNPSKRRYRTETFCYGPLSCPLYRAGPKRKVPGRNGMSYTEEDWVDGEETSHREADD